VSGFELWDRDGELRAVRYHGGALDVLAERADEFVDAVVTDPPYELGFMGRAWDASGIAYNVELWKQCFRVLKPGGHLLAFGGTRTSHRLTCAIEDAGFEIRDEIAWLYASGFPKSLDVSKAIDKARRRDYVLAAIALGLDVPGNNLHDWTKAEHSPGDAWWERFKNHLPADDWQRIEREVIGQRTRKATGRHAQGDGGYAFGEDFADTAPATHDAKRWAGWGTALKPAHEPIVVARKPLVGTVAANVLAHGAGALNIDACRVESTDALVRPSILRTDNEVLGKGLGAGVQVEPGGRWPTNVVLDEMAAAELDEQSGVSTSQGGSRGVGARGYAGGALGAQPDVNAYGDTGGASRFFPVFRYQAKAPTRERPKVDGVAHPTVKPLELMRWLVRLVTAPDGIVLDPFAGSGTTLEAATLEGMRCIGIEQSADYLPLIAERLRRAGLVPR
jgi:DNA modification methylase